MGIPVGKEVETRFLEGWDADGWWMRETLSNYVNQHDCVIMYDCWLCIFILCARVHCHRMYCNSEWCYGDTAYCNAMPCDIKAYQTMWVHAKKRHPNISQHISRIPMCLFPSSYEFFSLASTFIRVWSSSLKHAPRWFASTGVIWGASRESLSTALLCTCRSPLYRESTEKPTKCIKNP